MKNVIQNKKAFFNFTIIDKYIAGIQLQGTEVKSLRENRVSISESYCHFINDELYILGMHISEYKQIKYTNHEPVRNRKLLLNKKEIFKLKKEANEKKLTIIPISILLSDTGFFKVEIALAKGKKLYDKRESIKKKDLERKTE